MTTPSRPNGMPLRVSKDSNPASVAGAIAGVMREAGSVELVAIGAGAVNQAIKAVAIARGYVAANGLNLVIVPSFLDLQVNGEERTAIRFIIEPR